MKESSSQFNTVCPFLQGTFTQKTSLAGQTAFGTFRGRIVKKLSRQASTPFSAVGEGMKTILLVDEVSDTYLRRDYLSGPVPKLQLYDQNTATFVRPSN
jgi:hypothetical protein